MVLFKDALFRVEVEVILFQFVENLVDQFPFPIALNILFVGFSLLWPSMYHNVAHIDYNILFVNEVLKYSICHGLECGQRVGQPKEHHCWFEESLVGYECHFPPILLFDKDLIISPLNVKACKECAFSKLVN